MPRPSQNFENKLPLDFLKEFKTTKGVNIPALVKNPLTAQIIGIYWKHAQKEFAFLIGALDSRPGKLTDEVLFEEISGVAYNINTEGHKALLLETKIYYISPLEQLGVFKQ